MPILRTRNFSAASASGLTACSKDGRNEECQTRIFWPMAFAVSTVSMRFFSACEKARNRSHRVDVAIGPSSEFSRSVSLLAQTRLHQFWRTDWSDRDHADRVGREEEVDQPIAISARAQLLHALAGSGGATAGHLRWLASSQNLGRYHRRRVLRYSVNLRSMDVELHLCGLWKCAVDCRHLLWTE